MYKFITEKKILKAYNIDRGISQKKKKKIALK